MTAMLTATRNFDSENPAGDHWPSGVGSPRASALATRNTRIEKIDSAFCRRWISR
ncbi:hypothetical protein D3C84_1169360 [compost metagenome]